ncbi:MAG: hypothetical protein Q8M76_10990 [Spirochaetaceae bacterium]|nr:hypothetical protein [Spirochaetaceae bacterium]
MAQNVPSRQGVGIGALDDPYAIVFGGDGAPEVWGPPSGGDDGSPGKWGPPSSDVRLAVPETPDFAILVEVVPPCGSGRKPDRCALGLPRSMFAATCIRLAFWRREIRRLGGHVRVRILERDSPGGWKEWTRPPTEDELIAKVYEEQRVRHLRWLYRKAPRVAETEPLEGYHGVVVKALGLLRAGEIDFDKFRKELGFAHYDVIDAWRWSERQPTTFDPREGSIADEFGYDAHPDFGDEQPSEEAMIGEPEVAHGGGHDARPDHGFGHSPEQAMVDKVEVAHRGELVRRLPEALEVYANSRAKWVRETIAYLRGALERREQATPKNLAEFRGVDHATAWRNLKAIYRMLRVVLPSPVAA